MKRQFKIELKKALFSPYFFLAIGILSIFAVLSAVYILVRNGGYNEAILNDANFSQNPDLPLFSFYSSWIGSERMSLTYTLFYNLLPIGAALPFAWSFCSERKSGYIKNIVTRDKKKYYYLSKSSAIFISGMLAVLIPLLINILLVSSKMPLHKPFVGYNFYTGVNFHDLFADIYFSHPIFYVLLFVALTSIYGGVFALFGAALSFYISNTFTAVLLPFVIMLAAAYTEHMLQINKHANVVEYIPTQFLHASTLYGGSRASVVILVTAILMLFSILTIYIKGVRNEVF